MSPQPISAQSAAGKRLLDQLQNDLRTLSNEAKKKHPPLKEAAESGIVKLRSASSKSEDLRLALLTESPELLEPFFMGCDSKAPKIVILSLSAIQRLITFEAVSPVAAINLINCLWNLMESGLEELKVLQTITLLISTNTVVHGDALAKGLALCFRLHFTKNQTTNNAASATVRQIVSVIFERAQKEDVESQNVPAQGQDATTAAASPPVSEYNFEELKQGSRYPPKSLRPAAGDAFLLFQDLVQLVNADQPFWLNGLTEMTRTFGLELLESIFTNFPEIFFKHEEFGFLLKERVCPLVIKLFSPNIKYKPHPGLPASLSHLATAQQQQQTTAAMNSADKPFYPISMRLLRIVNVLIQKFYTMLITESEIFLSLLIKFLDGEKPCWQRAVALEVLHKMCTQPNLLKSFCLFYDMKPHSSKIFRDIVTALGLYVQSQFISPPITPSLLTSLINAATTQAATSTNATAGGSLSQPGSSTLPSNAGQSSQQPSFLFRGTWIPVLFTLKPGQTKSYYLEQLEKLEVPTIPDGYGLTTAYHSILETIRCLVVLVDGDLSALDPPASSNNHHQQQQKASVEASAGTKKRIAQLQALDGETRALRESLLASSWCGLLGALSVLLESSTDEAITETILRHMEQLVSLYGIYGITAARDGFVVALCRSSLPIGYNLSSLMFKLPTNSGTSTPDTAAAGDQHHNGGSNGTAANNGGAVTADNHSRSSSIDLSMGSSSSASMSLLSSNATILQQQLQSTNNHNSYLSASPSIDASVDLRQQVVAVGTALVSSDLNSTQMSNSAVQGGPVMLTAKNLQCMRAVLTVAQCHGCTLDGSWLPILTTLQHLVWILGLKPSTGGSLKVSRPGTEAGASTSSLITTAAMSDLPMLTTLLSRLFESSHYAPLANLLSRVFHFSQDLDDAGLIHLIEALCKLSADSMEMAYGNREPSLFAVAKLLETGLVNIYRIDVVWKPLTSHLLEVSRHPQHKLREWGAEAITSLVKAVMTADNSPVKKNGEKFMYLSALQDLSLNTHSDIRQKQLDTCLQILQSCGETLGTGWPQLLDVVSAINENQNENLIRLAFQCLQLIIGDFMPSMPVICIILVVDATAKFGCQTQEMNVSLTAIGSLWNIADFIFQNESNIRSALAGDEPDGKKRAESELPAFECLWMSLFGRLGDLCTDARPAIRKSASQTLFSTLSTHGDILEPSSWQTVLGKVIFPLLERVKHLSTVASSDRITDANKAMGGNSSGSILLHHSRNTAQKQWSETQVLTLSGSSRIFSLKSDQFASTLPDFIKSWRTLLEYIEFCALSRSAEVSLAALRALNDLVVSFSPTTSVTTGTAADRRSTATNDSKPSTPATASTSSNSSASISSSDREALHALAWTVWSNIATEATRSPTESDNVDLSSLNKINTDDSGNYFYIPSQAFLTSLIQIFPFLFHHVKEKFTAQDFAKLTFILQSSVAVPVDVATQAYLMSAATTAAAAAATTPATEQSAVVMTVGSGSMQQQQASQVPLTPMQEAIIFVIETINAEIFTILNALPTMSGDGQAQASQRLHTLCSFTFNTLLTFVSYACTPPSYGRAVGKPSQMSDWLSISYVPFGERCLRMVATLYPQLATLKCVIQDNVLHLIVKALKIPLCLKYNCPAQSTWKLAINSLLSMLQVGLPVARNHGTEFVSIWADLANTLEGFLFPVSRSSPTQTLEEQQSDEQYDVKVVELIRDGILPYPNQMPKEFVLQIVSILNKGSIHSTTSDSPVDTDSTRKLREDFARTCFETLLQFSFLGPRGNPQLFIQSPSTPTGPPDPSNFNFEIGLVNKLAVTSLLQRFREVVIKYLEDEKLSGKCPLARHRFSEISFVLKALATLVSSLKKAPVETVENGVWEQLIALYPHLVDCTTSNCAQVNRSLREVLHEYQDLLRPPVRHGNATLVYSNQSQQQNNANQKHPLTQAANQKVMNGI